MKAARIIPMLRRSLQAFRLPSAVMAIAITMAIFPAPESRAADTELVFNPVAKGLSRQLVDRAWTSSNDYKAYVDFLGMLPPYAIATQDVNGDKTPEIFARHSDPDSGFCDPQGVACLMVVYAYTSTGLYEIGRMMAAGQVMISDYKTQNINDLIVNDSSLKRVTYRWNGKAYEKSY